MHRINGGRIGSAYADRPGVNYPRVLSKNFRLESLVGKDIDRRPDYQPAFCLRGGECRESDLSLILGFLCLLSSG